MERPPLLQPWPSEQFAHHLTAGTPPTKGMDVVR